MQKPNAKAHIYTQEEVRQYLDRIQFYATTSTGISEDRTHDPLPEPTLEVLYELVKKHQIYIPYENFALHYSVEPHISIEYNDMFQKLVVNKRGGYCFEQNLLFLTMLRSMGYAVSGGGGKTSRNHWYLTEIINNTNRFIENEEYYSFNGISHMLSFVLIDNKIYAVDVGFGGIGMTKPIELKEGIVQDSLITPEQHGLVKIKIPGYEHGNVFSSNGEDGRLWAVVYRKGPEMPWIVLYVFNEKLGMTWNDYDILNYWVSKSPEVMFTNIVVATRLGVEKGAAGEEKYYKINLRNTKMVLKRGGGGEGEVQVLGNFTTEKQRMELIEKWYNVKFTEEEKAAIENSRAKIQENNN